MMLTAVNGKPRSDTPLLDTLINVTANMDADGNNGLSLGGGTASNDHLAAEESADEAEELPKPGNDEAKQARLDQLSLFRSLVLEKGAEYDARQARKKQNGSANVDKDLSVEELMDEQGKAIVDDPREYQQELYERAKKENTIAVLETGSGKTLIAVLLIRHILDQELEDRAQGLLPRITFFLVPVNALVYQQTAVLKHNLDQPITARCGDMNPRDSLEMKAWEELLAKNMVVVCTPEILRLCLTHSIVTMAQINLLIFDEAHHAKKKHPYAAIIQDHYKKMPRLTRKPRIFGMTASPVDAKSDYILASRDLEELLHCKIATYPLAEQYRNKAKEMVWSYDALEIPFKTPLYLRLEQLLGHINYLDHCFIAARTLSSEIGPWAADKYWKFILKRDEENHMQGVFARSGNIRIADSNSKRVQNAYEIIENHEFGIPQVNSKHLSSKVIALYDLLREHYELDLKNRSIVFVEQKATARMLNDIFLLNGLPFLKPGLLTGHAEKFGDPQSTLRQQVVTMTKFRRGDINCLFATSVAEEGLDVPECNLVIRFDMYDTVIRYIQSKGRARHRNSKFVDMIEQGNSRQLATRDSTRFQEARLRTWVENLDCERKRSGNDQTKQNANDHGRFFIHPKSNAKLDYGSALGVLSLFASTLPADGNATNPEPAYIISSMDDMFFCEVIMPDHAPFRSAFGLRYPKKSQAKRSAAFEMCCKLLKDRFLNSHLLSVLKKLKPEGANAHLALSDKRTGKYDLRLKPSLWANGRGSIPEVLFLTVIDMPDGLERAHQPIGLLTRHALPDFPSFPLYLNSGKVSRVQTASSLSSSFEVTEEEVRAFSTYSLLLWDHVNAKKFKDDPPSMSYWIVPIMRDWVNQELGRACIDWKSLEAAVLSPHQSWTPGTENGQLIDRFIVDPLAGNRRFFSYSIDSDLKPLDPIPENSAKYDRPGAKKRTNILQYSVSLFGKAFDDAWPTWDQDQPVMVCTQVSHRQNLLAPATAKEQAFHVRSKTAYLCPEPLKISTLSIGIVTMFLVFPPIIHRIEEYLVALEATQIVGISVQPAIALEAMTKDSDNSDDHNTEDRINFRPGMGNNYERLEFLGDCFLKTATSISLFVIKPHDEEFEFHVARMNMICNKNLMNQALDLELPAYIRSKAFSRRHWYPEALILEEGKGAKIIGGGETHKHDLSDKSIADIGEALIGAAFIEHNSRDQWLPEKWTDAIKAVTKFANNPHHDIQKWEDYRSAYNPPQWLTAEATASQCDLVEKVFKEHKYRFRWPRLLRSAFLHPSNPYTWEYVPNYQRLEFLGDALLDLACVTHLFYNYEHENPQWLTEHKMAMVSNKFLGALCVKIGFYRHMRHNDKVMARQIEHYIEEVELAAETARETGEVDYWIHVSDPPKCLADIVEAYIGALFIDSDFNYAEVQRFFDEHIQPFFVDMTIYDTYANNHPTILMNHTLAQAYGCKAWRLLCETIDPSVIGGKQKHMAGLMVHSTLVAYSIGDSPRYSRDRASKEANQELQGLTVAEFRGKFGCDCKIEEGNEASEAADTDSKIGLASVNLMD